MDEKPIKTTGTKAAIEVAVACAGLLNPLVGLAAAAIKPALELVALRETRGLQNIAEVGAIVSDLTGLSADEIAEWAKLSDGRLDLTTRCVGAAYRTLLDRKVAALGRILAETVADDTQLDLSLLVSAVLADLEAPHVKVLDVMGELTMPQTMDGTQYMQLDSRVELAKLLPGFKEGIPAIVVALEGRGLIEKSNKQGNPWWARTSFGNYCLRRLGDGPGCERLVRVPPR